MLDRVPAVARSHPILRLLAGRYQGGGTHRRYRMSAELRKHGTLYRVVRLLVIVVSTVVAALALLIVAALVFPLSQSGEVKDEAMQAGRSAESMPGSDDDYFHDIDCGIALNSGERKGRTNWIVWTGGNDRFWDLISAKT